MDSPETKSLVAQAQGGNTQAFGELYNLYASRIYKFIRIKVPETTSAEDMLQDTFFKAWQALPKLKLDNLYFSAWLYQIARNLVNDFYRSHYRQPQTEALENHTELYDTSSPAHDASLALDLSRLKIQLKQLPAQYQQVIELRFIQEFDTAEVAQIMGRTPLAIRLIQHRALKKLHSLLSPSYETD